MRANPRSCSAAIAAAARSSADGLRRNGQRACFGASIRCVLEHLHLIRDTTARPRSAIPRASGVTRLLDDAEARTLPDQAAGRLGLQEAHEVPAEDRDEPLALVAAPAQHLDERRVVLGPAETGERGGRRVLTGDVASERRLGPRDLREEVAAERDVLDRPSRRRRDRCGRRSGRSTARRDRPRSGRPSSRAPRPAQRCASIWPSLTLRGESNTLRQFAWLTSTGCVARDLEHVAEGLLGGVCEIEDHPALAEALDEPDAARAETALRRLGDAVGEDVAEVPGQARPCARRAPRSRRRDRRRPPTARRPRRRAACRCDRRPRAARRRRRAVICAERRPGSRGARDGTPRSEPAPGAAPSRAAARPRCRSGATCRRTPPARSGGSQWRANGASSCRRSTSSISRSLWASAMSGACGTRAAYEVGSGPLTRRRREA